MVHVTEYFRHARVVGVLYLAMAMSAGRLWCRGAAVSCHQRRREGRASRWRRGCRPARCDSRRHRLTYRGRRAFRSAQAPAPGLTRRLTGEIGWRRCSLRGRHDQRKNCRYLGRGSPEGRRVPSCRAPLDRKPPLRGPERRVLPAAGGWRDRRGTPFQRCQNRDRPRRPDATWAKLLSSKPPRLYNDISVLIASKEVTLQADPVCYACITLP